jgi:hypothetical protein
MFIGVLQFHHFYNRRKTIIPDIQLYPKKAGFQFGFRFFQPKPKLKPIN